MMAADLIVCKYKVESLLGYQLCVCSLFDNHSLVDTGDNVGGLYGGQTMGDYDRCPTHPSL